ncbi:MAG: hypothetical protein WCR71_05590 [Bacteroidales bacterium]
MYKTYARIKTFTLPLEEFKLNEVINSDNITILDKKIFLDKKTGEVTLYMEYEERLEVAEPEE